LTDSDKDEVNESEDAFGTVGNVMTYYCRDFIFKDAPEDPDLKVAEMFVSGNQFLRDRLPISIKDEDIEDLRKNAKTGNYDTYRFMVYYVNSASDSKWYDAIDNIEDEWDYKDYIDRDSKIWRYDQEDFDEVVSPFLKEFPTYQAWKDHISGSCVERLKKILADSGKMPYEDAIDNVKVNEDGIAYVIIGWRA